MITTIQNRSPRTILHRSERSPSLSETILCLRNTQYARSHKWAIVRNRKLLSPSPFCCHHDNTISSPATIKGSSGSTLQDCYRLNILWVNVISLVTKIHGVRERILTLEIIHNRHTIHHIQRLISTERTDTTHDYFLRRACSTTASNIQTRNLTSQAWHHWSRLSGIQIFTLHSRGCIAQRLFLLFHTNRSYDNLLKILGTRLKDYPQHILYRNLTSNHAHIRNYQSLRGTWYIQTERTIKIRYCSCSSTFDYYRRTNNRFTVFGGNNSSCYFPRLSCGQSNA